MFSYTRILFKFHYFDRISFLIYNFFYDFNTFLYFCNHCMLKNRNTNRYIVKNINRYIVKYQSQFVINALLFSHVVASTFFLVCQVYISTEEALLSKTILETEIF